MTVLLKFPYQSNKIPWKLKILKLYPIVLRPEGGPLFNLDVMKKSKLLSSNPTSESKKPSVTEHPSKMKGRKQTDSYKEGVLCVTQGGKEIYKGKINIPRNLPTQLSQLKTVEKQRDKRNVMESPKKEFPPLH